MQTDATFEEITSYFAPPTPNRLPQLLEARRKRSEAAASQDSNKATGDSSTEKVSGCQIKMLEGHAKAIISAQFSPDGKTLASTAFDNSIKIWEVATGKELRMFGYPAPV
jgi:WD40 repeat protein